MYCLRPYADSETNAKCVSSGRSRGVAVRVIGRPEGVIRIEPVGVHSAPVLLGTSR